MHHALEDGALLLPGTGPWQRKQKTSYPRDVKDRMNLSPCFLYREDEHFTLPPELRAARRNACMFALKDGQGRALANPRIFRETSRPEDAEFFLFPWDIGQYIDGGRQDAISCVIAHLPYLAGREKRHIVCDDGDFTTAFSPPIQRF